MPAVARFFFTRQGGIEGEGHDRAQRLAAATRAHLGLPDEATVSVTERICGDPGCVGGAETVILVMRPGRRNEAAKVRKALAFVEEADLSAALAALSEGSSP